MATTVNKLRTAIDVLSENVLEYTIIEAIDKIAECPHFDESDMEHFIHYALKCNGDGIIPTYEEWFKIVASEKTGSSSH